MYFGSAADVNNLHCQFVGWWYLRDRSLGVERQVGGRALDTYVGGGESMHSPTFGFGALVLRW